VTTRRATDIWRAPSEKRTLKIDTQRSPARSMRESPGFFERLRGVTQAEPQPRGWKLRDEGSEKPKGCLPRFRNFDPALIGCAVASRFALAAIAVYGHAIGLACGFFAFSV